MSLTSKMNSVIQNKKKTSQNKKVVFIEDGKKMSITRGTIKIEHLKIIINSYEKNEGKLVCIY
jgi:hypothetical protein